MSSPAVPSNDHSESDRPLWGMLTFSNFIVQIKLHDLSDRHKSQHFNLSHECSFCRNDNCDCKKGWGCLWWVPEEVWDTCGRGQHEKPFQQVLEHIHHCEMGSNINYYSCASWPILIPNQCPSPDQLLLPSPHPSPPANRGWPSREPPCPIQRTHGFFIPLPAYPSLRLQLWERIQGGSWLGTPSSHFSQLLCQPRQVLIQGNRWSEEGVPEKIGTAKDDHRGIGTKEADWGAAQRNQLQRALIKWQRIDSWINERGECIKVKQEFDST